MSGATRVSDLEIAEHLGYDKGKGVKRVSIFNDGTQINAATEEKQDPLSSYQLANFDTSSSPLYIGKVDKDGAWFIKRIDTTTGEALYFKGDSDFDTGWGDHISLDYKAFNLIF